jgi:hypothetical protein
MMYVASSSIEMTTGPGTDMVVACSGLTRGNQERHRPSVLALNSHINMQAATSKE